MGVYFLLFPSAGVLTLIPLLLIFPILGIPAWFYLGYWFVLQFLSGAAGAITSRDGGIAVWAHVGGFLSGLAMIKGLPKRRVEETYELGECGTTRLRVETPPSPPLGPEQSKPETAFCRNRDRAKAAL